MRRLLALFVCPCWRCREARLEERERLSPEEVAARLRALVDSGRFAQATSRTGAEEWRRAIERRKDEWPR